METDIPHEEDDNVDSDDDTRDVRDRWITQQKYIKYQEQCQKHWDAFTQGKRRFEPKNEDERRKREWLIRKRKKLDKQKEQ